MIENHMVLHFDDYNVNKEYKAFCDGCGADVSDEDRYTVDGKTYCEECFDYEFAFDDDAICENCGFDKATHIIPGGGCLCEDCAKRRYKE